MKACVLLLTCANEGEAKAITSVLLEKKLVACVKMVHVSSSSLWKTNIESSDEVLLIMDSIEENFKKTEKEVRKLHTYDTTYLKHTMSISIE